MLAGLLLITVTVAAGCSKSNGSGSKAQPGAVPKAANSVWDPDPARTNQLTQLVTLDKYQLSLPKDFAAEKLGGPPPKGMQLFVWKGQADGDRPPLVFIATVTAGKAEVAEAKQNMRQAMVNFSAGMANTFHAKIAKRGATETGSLGGMAFSRFKWTGTTDGQGPAHGMVYGSVDGERAIMLLPITFQPDPEQDMRLIEAVMATLKKP